MKTVMRAVMLVSCLSLAGGMAVKPALAQANDPTDLYGVMRGRYIQEQLGPTTANLNTRRDAYLNQIKDTPSFWWDIWEKHQPYSKDVTYSQRPGIMDIPTQPGIASNSSYGRNITDLVYGNNRNPNARSAANVIAPTQPTTSILDDEINYGTGNSDINAKLNSASYPGQPLTPRIATPVNNNDVRAMLPQ